MAFDRLRCEDFLLASAKVPQKGIHDLLDWKLTTLLSWGLHDEESFIF